MVTDFWKFSYTNRLNFSKEFIYHGVYGALKEILESSSQTQVGLFALNCLIEHLNSQIALIFYKNFKHHIIKGL